MVMGISMSMSMWECVSMCVPCKQYMHSNNIIHIVWRRQRRVVSLFIDVNAF